jgi:lactoylglutathione lyase
LVRRSGEGARKARDAAIVAVVGRRNFSPTLLPIALLEKHMRYLHTMVRVRDLDESLDFYVNKLGLVETRRIENEKGRFTLVFLAAPDDAETAKGTKAPLMELTYNWGAENYSGGRNFGHLAYEVDDIYETCRSLMDKGVVINRPPRDGNMAFVKSPDNISFELLQKGPAKAPVEPWISMENTGSW